MSAYDELIRKLRNRRIALQAGLSSEDFPLLREAADAIENLQGQLSVCLEGTKVRFLKNDDGTTEVRFENQWVPVTERLPEERVPVLAICKNGVMFVAEYEWTNYDGAHWNTRGPLGSGRRIGKARVTHWMPLPSTEGLNET